MVKKLPLKFKLRDFEKMSEDEYDQLPYYDIKYQDKESGMCKEEQKDLDEVEISKQKKEKIEE